MLTLLALDPHSKDTGVERNCWPMSLLSARSKASAEYVRS